LRRERRPDPAEYVDRAGIAGRERGRLGADQHQRLVRRNGSERPRWPGRLGDRKDDVLGDEGRGEGRRRDRVDQRDRSIRCDVAGNVSTKTFQYRVAYAICLKYDPSQAKNIGSTVGLVLQLCNATGTNLSAANITLTGVAADNNGNLLSPNGPGGSNPTFTFL